MKKHKVEFEASSNKKYKGLFKEDKYSRKDLDVLEDLIFNALDDFVNQDYKGVKRLNGSIHDILVDFIREGSGVDKSEIKKFLDMLIKNLI